MDRPVEVARYHRGEIQTVRVLSAAAELRAAKWAGGIAAAVVLTAMLASLLVMRSAGLLLHAPTFFVSWGAVTAIVAMVAVRRAAARAGRYVLGASMDSDAFAATDLDLVRRTRGGYEIGLVAGMTGSLDAGRTPMPIEALTDSRTVVRVPVPDEGVARIEWADGFFVVRHVTGAATTPSEKADGSWTGLLRAGAAWVAPSLRFFRRAALTGIPVAALVTLIDSTPVALAVGEADMRSPIPSGATPWEAERHLRLEAQRQAQSLHQCFDPLPLACHHAGYVGVGLRLAKSGEVKEHWISRSTYGAECPVTACMESVISGWFFDSIPEDMSVVIPVQVLRTSKRMDPTVFAGAPVHLAHPSFPARAAIAGRTFAR